MNRRAFSLGETVIATSLAVVAVSALGTEVLRQHRELGLARAKGALTDALSDAAERLHSGVLPVPQPGETRTLEGTGMVEVRLERDRRPLDPRLAAGGRLVSVRLRAAWQGAAESAPRPRELVVLVSVGGGR